MEEGERKEKVFFLPPCWRQQEPGKDWLSTIHQEKTSHQKVSKKNRGREKARRQQGEQPGSAARHLPGCKVSLEVSKPHCILLAKEHMHGWSSDLGKENNGKWSFIKRNEMGEKSGEKRHTAPECFGNRAVLHVGISLPHRAVNGGICFAQWLFEVALFWSLTALKMMLRALWVCSGTRMKQFGDCNGNIPVLAQGWGLAVGCLAAC